MPVISELQTQVGLARLWWEPASSPGQPRATLVLGHGAGGGVDAPDLLAAQAAGLALGLQVLRVEQPWRVAGRRVAVAPAQLDVAWLEVCAAVAGPLVVGGRSAGARVACRTATATGAIAVLCLAFPLVPPQRTNSRAAELALPDVPLLVVQGSRDRFGVPEQAQVVEGADHGFATRKKDGRTPGDVAADIEQRVTDWLATVLPGAARG